MKKEVLRKEKIDFCKGLFLLIIFAVVMIFICVGGVFGQYPGYIGTTYKSPTTPGSTATAPTVPVFDATKPADWYKFPADSAKYFNENPQKFLEGIKTLSSTATTGYSQKTDELWSTIITKIDKNALLKLNDAQFQDLWKKIGWNNAAKTIQLGEPKNIIPKLTSEQIRQMLKVGFTEHDLDGSDFKNKETVENLKKIRDDSLLETYNNLVKSDGNDPKKPKTTEFFNNLYKSFFDSKWKLTDAGKVGLDNLLKSLENDRLKDVREAFVVSVAQNSGILKIPERTDGKKYKGLEEFKINNPDYKASRDENGNLILKYKDKVVLDITNAQIWNNKINVDADGKLILQNSGNGDKLILTSGDIANLDKPINFNNEPGQNFGQITINKFVFNTRGGAGATTEFKITIEKDKITLNGKDGWINDGMKFFTGPGGKGDFTTIIQRSDKTKTGQISSIAGKGVQYSIVVSDKHPWEPGVGYDPSTPEGLKKINALGFTLEKGEASVAVYGPGDLNPEIIGNVKVNPAQAQPAQSGGRCTPGTPGCSGGCGAGGCGTPVPILQGAVIPQEVGLSGTDGLPQNAVVVDKTNGNELFVYINGANAGNQYIHGDYLSPDTKIAISVAGDASDVYTSRISQGQMLIQAGKRFTYQDNGGEGFAFNPTPVVTSGGSVTPGGNIAGDEDLPLPPSDGTTQVPDDSVSGSGAPMSDPSAGKQSLLPSSFYSDGKPNFQLIGNIKPDLTNPNQVVGIKFYSQGCAPCIQIAPLIEQASSSTTPFIGVDAGANHDLALQYGVAGVPAIVFIKNGVVQGGKPITVSTIQRLGVAGLQQHFL